MKDILKSSLITFISTFALAVIPFLGDATWDKATIVALILVGVRAGVKALFAYLGTLK